MATASERTSLLVVQAEAHREMWRKLHLREFARLDLHARRAPQERGKRLSQRLIAWRFRLDEGACEIRRGHEVAAQCLGQATNQFGHLVTEQTRHQPLA